MNNQIKYDSLPWLSHYENGVPSEIRCDQTVLPGFLKRTAERFSDHIALNFQGYTITYRQLYDMVERFAGYLYKLGIRKGDKVAILLPNMIPCVVSYYAVLRIGGIVVMNNPLYSDRELEHQFNDSGSRILITLDLLANRMIDLRLKTKIKQIIYTSIGDYLPLPKKLLFILFGKLKKLAASVKRADKVYDFKGILKKDLPPAPDVRLTFDDVAMYQYTGGTTGVSKGVMLTHGNISTQAQQLKAWLPQFEIGKEIMLSALPFFHVFGLTVCMNLSIYMGWQNILVPKPHADSLIEMINNYRPTFTPMVPTMYISILNHPDIDRMELTSIKGCFSGGAPLPVEIIRGFEEKTGAVIIEGYGLTESSPVTHINPFADGERKVGSIGIPVPDTKCRIVDIKDGKTDMPVGQPGELIIRGPQVMKGYLNNPKETAETFSDGWLHTGDIAKMDEEGYFYIVDRKKEMILSGGYNVYPRDIEEVIYEHPDIKEVAVIGIPHPTRGEAAKVFVVLKDSRQMTSKELIEYCSTRLAKYKLPTEIEFRNELPKSAVGKILKKELKAEEVATGRSCR